MHQSPLATHHRPRLPAALVIFGAVLAALVVAAASSLIQAPAEAQGEPERGPAQLSGHASTPSAELPVDALLGPVSDHRQIVDVGGAQDSLFRIECGFSHFAYDDPLRSPGEFEASPLQMFFGNTETDASTDYGTLLDQGESTCSGGALDRSAYYLPAVFDERDRAVVPSYFVVHYKTHAGSGRDGVAVQPFPEGLRLTAGDPSAAAPQDAGSPHRAIEFSCDDGARGDAVVSSMQSSVIPACDPGSGGGQSSVKTQVRFPFCWDGQRLSSVDGSHMSMPVDGFHSVACPASHPVVLPSLEYNVFFDIPAGASTDQWRLSSDGVRDGGTTLYGSWFGGWNRSVLSEWVRGCSNVPGARCAQGLLGEDSGRALKRLEPFFGPWEPFTVATADDLAELCGRSQPSPDRCGEVAVTGRGEATPPVPERDVLANGSGTSFDTAWEMPHRASNGEIITYLDHLDAAGFDGSWISLLPFGASYFVEPPDVGDRIAVKTGSSLHLTDAYAGRIAWILDEAAARDLRIGLVVAWARANTCHNDGVTPSNGAEFGEAVARSFGQKPALAYWVLGGDVSAAECGGSTLLETSRALAAGIRRTGVSQPIAFHTGAGVENYLTFNAEPWLDVQAVQTGHCQDATTMRNKLVAVVAASEKPVILAEARYYLLAPPWRGCLHSQQNPVGPSAITSDVQAGQKSGVVAQLFGDSRRYQWCNASTDLVRPADACVKGIESTFATQGELAFLDAMRR